ncbi:MAG: radical SAM protein [Cyanobacteriota bacterium]
MKAVVLIPPSKHAKNVARDLVYGCWCKGKRIGGIKFPPVSQLIVVTTLKKFGHNCDLLDAAALGLSLQETIEIIKKYKYLIMLTSTMTINEDAAFVSNIKQVNTDLISIFYGAHPTFMPKYTLAKEGVDFIIQREPEFIIRDLLSALKDPNSNFKNIKGIGYKSNSNIIINEPYPFIENLDELPIPDRSLLIKNIDYYNPVVKRMPYTTMFTSRGCPGRCTYCTSPPFYGTTYRARSSESVMEELELISKEGYKEIFLRDEMFTTDKNRVIQICEGIITKKLDLTWIASTRVGAIDEEMVKLMKKAGCHMLRFGVESGVQEILNNVKKGIKVEQTINDFNLTRKHKIDTHAHCMLGMPGETEETIKQSLKFVKQIDPTIITFGICTPYPGTKLFEKVIEKHPEVGDGSDCDLEKLHTNSFYNDVYTNLSNDQLNSWIKKIYRDFYFRPTYILKWLNRINSIDELRRVTLAGAQVLDFAFLGKE